MRSILTCHGNHWVEKHITIPKTTDYSLTQSTVLVGWNVSPATTMNQLGSERYSTSTVCCSAHTTLTDHFTLSDFKLHVHSRFAVFITTKKLNMKDVVLYFNVTFHKVYGFPKWPLLHQPYKGWKGNEKTRELGRCCVFIISKRSRK